MESESNKDPLITENEELKNQLLEAQNLIEAIKDGAIDALVVNDNGKPTVYSLETADYTYRLLIEKCSEGALSISDTGIILYCNEYFSKIVNVPADKLVGTFFISYVESIGKFNDLQTKLSTGVSKGEVILNINGKKIPVYLSLTNLQPSLPAIGIIVSDLSEKKQHEEDIAQYQKELEQFLHLISHNINEPVRKILSYTSDMMAENPVHKRRESVKAIDSSAQRLSSFVSELVRNSANSNLNKTEVDLKVIVNEVVDDMELIIKENCAKLQIRSLPKINGLPVQLRQLFFNCIVIILKTINSNPDIEIESETTDCVDPNLPNKNYHKISIIGKETKSKKIQDTGSKFFPLNSDTSLDGIENAICAKIMKNHSGIMEHELTEEENRFYLYFPV